MAIDIKSPEEIDILSEGGARLGSILRRLGQAVRPGISTFEIDTLAREYIHKEGGKPSFLGHHGFPGAVCVSIDEEVVHGLPTEDRLLEEGDVVGIDIGMWFKGFCTDTAITVPVGDVDEDIAELLSVTDEALRRGIQQSRVGLHIGDISSAIQVYVESEGFGLVRDLGGHGVGRKVHEEPFIPNVGKPGMGEELRVGMILAIEPMVTLGKPDVELAKDNWTYLTKDRNIAAHFEHTVAITADGPLVLTKR